MPIAQFWLHRHDRFILFKGIPKLLKKYKDRVASRAGVRVSGGDLCEAEAPTEAAAETTALPIITPSSCENGLFQ